MRRALKSYKRVSIALVTIAIASMEWRTRQIDEESLLSIIDTELNAIRHIIKDEHLWENILTQIKLKGF